MSTPSDDPLYSLILYVYPSPHGVDWKSPHALAKSAVRNAVSRKKRMIGHVAVELKSEANELTIERFFTGMSTKFFSHNKKLLLWDRLGLGILFHQYPGHLEKSEELDPEREDRLRSGHFSIMKFLLSEASYMKVRRYLTEYEEQKKYVWYGLPNRPRYGEGAGCSAFAASVLEIAGVMSDEFRENWSGTVKIPEEFFGEKKSGKKVSFFKLILPTERNSRWAKDDESGRKIFFWDPDMMHRWITKKWNQSPLDSRYKKTKIKNTPVLELDLRSQVPSAESIWL